MLVAGRSACVERTSFQLEVSVDQPRCHQHFYRVRVQHDRRHPSSLAAVAPPSFRPRPSTCQSPGSRLAGGGALRRNFVWGLYKVTNLNFSVDMCDILLLQHSVSIIRWSIYQLSAAAEASMAQWSLHDAAYSGDVTCRHKYDSHLFEQTRSKLCTRCCRFRLLFLPARRYAIIVYTGLCQSVCVYVCRNPVLRQNGSTDLIDDLSRSLRSNCSTLY